METSYRSSYGPSGTAIAVYLIIGIICIIGCWKVFVKAGKPGWASIIPIYNIIVMLEIVGKPLWWIILLFVPCVNVVFGIWIINLLSKSFGKNEGFTIGLIFLGFIFFPILGFGDAVYLGPAGAADNNRFGASDYQKPFDNNNPEV